jgi:hypothetical protein
VSQERKPRFHVKHVAQHRSVRKASVPSATTSCGYRPQVDYYYYYLTLQGKHALAWSDKAMSKHHLEVRDKPFISLPILPTPAQHLAALANKIPATLCQASHRRASMHYGVS